MASRRAVCTIARTLTEPVMGGKKSRRLYSVAPSSSNFACRLRHYVGGHHGQHHNDLLTPSLCGSALDLWGTSRIWSAIQTRFFAKQRRSAAKANDTLANEKLVALIMKKFPDSSPDDVQVRTVMEQQGKSTSDVMSLKMAIQLAVESDRDLVEVALDKDIPVVKAVALTSLEYRSRKQKSVASALSVKEFQVKAGIAENDLMRKMDQMIGFLRKGHRTRIRIRGTRKAFTRNPQVVVDTLQEVLDILQEEEAGELVNPPEFNEQRTQCQALLQTPPKKK